jgi:hypothetical protein
MGDGHFGGDGSVQWRVRHHAGAALVREQAEIDPIPFEQIGTRPGLGLRPQKLKVTLEYGTAAEAEAARAEALNGTQLVLYVPVVDRRDVKEQSRPMEVLVEW